MQQSKGNAIFHVGFEGLNIKWSKNDCYENNQEIDNIICYIYRILSWYK